MGVRRLVVPAIASAAICLLSGAVPPAVAESGQLPSLGISPPGANDFDCEPAAEHPLPVVLVHGTFLDMTSDWGSLSPKLHSQGYCVFALDYGGRGTGRIQDSGHQLAEFIDEVLAATGARRVAIVGHSQGGMMPRWYVKHLGGDRAVAEIVGLVPSNHGTKNPLAPPLDDLGACRACGQQVAGSRFITRLNGGDETPGPIDYTQITTSYDEVVTPFASAYLDGPRARVTNVLVQDRCPLDVFEHALFTYDPVAIQWVENALAHDGPAKPGFKPNCLLAQG